jgi:ABC-type branched-subunit amino acid transport system substrate-binding protein
MQDAMTAHKLVLGLSIGLTADGANLADSAAALAAHEPQAVVMFLGSPVAAALMEALSRTRLRANFYGASLVAGETVAKMLGGRARGLVVAEAMSSPTSSVDPSAREYRRLCEAARVPVNYTSFEGYVNARLMQEALKRTGRDVTSARLHAAIRSIKLRFAAMEFDFTGGGHTGSRFVDLVQVSTEGRFVR